MVSWAPLRLPLQRRLQTGAVLLTMWLLPLVLTMLAAAALFPPLTAWYSREALLAYLLWQFTIDRRTPVAGGRPIAWVRRWRLWRYVAAYFPATLHTPPPAAPGGPAYDPGRTYIFGVHPHGVISLGAVCNLVFDVNEPSRRIGVPYRVLTVTANFAIPLWRELIMGLGFVSASRESAAALLEAGTSVMVVVGGAAEALDAHPGSTALTVKKRKGFVRLALQHGACLVPVYNFGENEAYSQVANPRGSALRKWQERAIRWLGFTIPLVRGRGVFQYDVGILPRRATLNTVMGPAIPVPRVEHPSAAVVDEYHAKYVAALETLYNAHAKAFCRATDAQGRPVSPPPLRFVQ